MLSFVGFYVYILVKAKRIVILVIKLVTVVYQAFFCIELMFYTTFGEPLLIYTLAEAENL